MPGRTPATTRQQLLKDLDALPAPEPRHFRKIDPPPPSELKSYRIIEDRALRTRLVNVGLVEIVQSPGQGNWTKATAPAYIGKVYLTFDAPQRSATAATARSTGSSASAKMPLPGALLHDLRSKREAYYAGHPAGESASARAALANEGREAMLVRAKELIVDARKAGRSMRPRDALLRATDELTADFETAMRWKYGDIVVDVLGRPNAIDTRAWNTEA